MGEIFKPAGRKTWAIRWYDENGERHMENASRDYEEAKRILRDREGDVAKGTPIGQTLGANTFTFDEGAKLVVNDYIRKKNRSLDGVLTRLRLHLRPWFGADCPMRDITLDRINQYIADRLAEGAADATVNRDLAILRRMLRLAVAARRLTYRPDIAMITEDNTRQGFFERDEFDAVHRELPTWFQGATTFAYWTGWRLQSEVATLEWRHLDTAQGLVTLEPKYSKNKKGRVFPYTMLPALEAVINQQLRSRAALQKRGILCLYVFHMEDGSPLLVTKRRKPKDGDRDLTKNGVKKREYILSKSCRDAWNDACRKAGVTARMLHDFRRTACRNLIDAGVSTKEAMELTGHKTVAVFLRYQIVSLENLRDSVSKLAHRHDTTAPRKRGRILRRS